MEIALKEEKRIELGKVEETPSPGNIAEGKFGLGNASYKLVTDNTQTGVEERYFWTMRFLSKTAPYGRSYSGKIGTIIKVKDIYTAGETSSYWGSVEQRKGAQIDKFQQIMANVGNMLKTLFQLLRELRIMDERIDYYERSNKGDEAAEVSLKSIWADMVEGGAKNPSSVLGLAQVGFVILPDLFFSIHPKNQDDVQTQVDKLEEGGINRKVREVLARKLIQYVTWKEKTYHELKIGHEFKLKYMAQHYHVIKLYLNWLRPYLRNVRRLQMKESSSDKDVIAAFETSKIELEILGVKYEYEKGTFGGNMEPKKFTHFFPCVRVRINFVAIPELSFQQDYQRGAVHRGRSEILIDGFVTTEEKINNYIKKLDEDDFELLAAVDKSILSLKDDLEYYLEKAGQLKKEEEKPAEKPGVIDPIASIFRGFRDLIKPQKSEGGRPKNAKLMREEEDAAKSLANIDTYLVYKIFKQAHGMMTE